MKDAPVRHAAEYGAYCAVKLLVRAVPHAAVRPLGHRLGALARLALPAKRAIALENVRLGLPELSPEARRDVVRRCFRHFGACFLEALSAFRFTREAFLGRFEVDDPGGVLDRAAAGGGPLLLTAGHYGYWELGGYPLTARLGGLKGVARPPDNPWVARDVHRSRERLGLEVIERQGAAFQALRVLRRGESAALVIDQHLRPSAAIQVPFLGRPAWTSPVLAMLSVATGTPVVHFRCLPLPRGRYRVEVRGPIEPEGSGEAAEAEMTRRYMAEIERDIHEDPSLWLWMHRRWR